MKLSALILFFSFFCISLFANNPAFEKKEKKTTLELEISKLVKELFDTNLEFPESSPNEKFKIVIMDSEFNILREESIEKIDNLYNQSILVPLIYRSELITKINGVSYYILR